jgi:hypothetical protein
MAVQFGIRHYHHKEIDFMREGRNIIDGLNIISEWAKMHPEQRSWSFPGLKDEEIQKLFTGFPFEIPRELYDVYKNGHTQIELSSGLYYFMSIPRSIEDCLNFRFLNRIESSIIKSSDIGFFKFHEGCFENENYINVIRQYPLDWCEFPICYGFGKEAYLVRCHKEETDSSPVWVNFIGQSPILYTSSLTNLILAQAECYETGAYYSIYDEDDDFYDFRRDWSKVEPIFEKYNLPMDI